MAAFHTLLSQPIFAVPHPVTGKAVPPSDLCPILQTLHKILHTRLVPQNTL